MESHGVAGRVQVSESTRRLLGEAFLLEERGALEVEGKGELKTWFVGGRNGAEEAGVRDREDDRGRDKRGSNLR
jgi:adenylate cyclase